MILAVTSDANWLTLQAHKVESFTQWAGMSVNCKKCGVTGMLYHDAKTTMVQRVLGGDAIRLLQSRLSHVKFKGEPVPFLHPDNEPYTYLGVDITPTMNWAFQVDKVVRDMKDNGEKLEDSMLSRTQKLYFIKTVIVTKASCTFPLGNLCPTDLAKLDSIYSRICKKSVGIPLSSPTALVFEDRSKAGIGMPSLQVEYTQRIAEALVYALQDPGHLGTVSRALLYLQNSIVGNLIQDKRARTTLRQVTHYHLARKLATIQETVLKLTLPKGNTDLVGNLLCEQLAHVKFNPNGGGYVHEVPVSMYLPLLELGYSSFADLLTKDRSPVVISTAELKKRHKGIGRRHTLALNKLTVLVNEVELDRQAIDEAQGYTKVGAIEYEQRKVRNPAFTELCTRTTEHISAAALHTQERSALQMLRSHHMTAAARDSNGSFDAFIENLMHEGEDTDMPDGTIADAHDSQAVEQKQWAQRDVDGRLLHEQIINTESWDTMYEEYSKISNRRRKGQVVKPKNPPLGTKNFPPSKLTLEEYISWMTLNSDDYTIITPLYGHLDEAEGILADSWTKGQKQYLVQWKPTPCRDRHIELHEARGYEVADRVHLDGGDKSFLGNNADEVASLVFWKPKWEYANNFAHSDNPTQERMAQAYEQEKATQPALKLAATTSRRQDTGKTNLDRQGQWVSDELRPERRLWCKPGLKRLIHIDPEDTVNPDQDIVPTGRYTTGLTAHACITPPVGPLVNIYSDDGKVVGTITTERLNILYTAFNNMLNNEPVLMSTLGATCFEHEVALLMNRYKITKEDDVVKANELRRSTPDVYMQAFKDGLGIQCERFASPLDFNPEMQQYYSLHDRDKVFGANTDAYSTKWHGASQAYPPWTPDGMDKAMKWAILSAQQSSEATLTLLMLPEDKGSSYCKWTLHPRVTLLTQIQKQHIRFKFSHYWETGLTRGRMPATAVNIMLVANEAGLSSALGTLQKESNMRASLLKAMESSGDRIDSSIIHGRQHMQQWRVRALARHSAVQEGLYEPKQFGDKAYLTGRLWISQTSRDSAFHIPQQQLRYQAGSMIYTDGSYKKDTHRAGAGVYSCRDETDVRITIRPSKPGPINTINRAELAALLYALRRWQDSTDMTIVTDSQSSMQAINAQLRDPNDHKCHVHKHMLQAIADIILDRAELGRHTSIVKVRSHTGIHGNDWADILANQAADGDAWDVDMSDELVEPYDDMFWIKQSFKDSQGAENSEQFLRNLQDCAKAAIHDKCKLGRSNTDTTMVRAWRGVEDDLMQDITCGFWEEDHKVNDAMLRNVLKCRFSQLWHMGKAHMFRMPYFPGGPVATNDACPLCGQPDSGSHMLGGCSHPKMKKLTIFRHDVAHRMMLKGIINKGKMGSFLVIADVGKSETLRPIGVHHKRIPDWVLPDSVMATAHEDVQAARGKMRPDIMIVELDTRNGPEGELDYLQGPISTDRCPLPPTIKEKRSLGCFRFEMVERPRKIWLLEGGYCADTKVQDKIDEKMQQHDELKKLLMQYGYECIYMAFPLGHAGAIYKINFTALTEHLGVPKTAARKMLKDLHMHAITCLHSIIMCRRHLEARHKHGAYRRNKG